MRKITAELWNGNLSPIGQRGKNDPEIQNLIELIERNKDDLFGTLDNHQKAILENYGMCLDEYEFLITEQAFGEGFSLACKLLTEALSSPPPIF